jgi:hypothetical protein
LLVRLCLLSDDFSQQKRATSVLDRRTASRRVGRLIAGQGQPFDRLVSASNDHENARRSVRWVFPQAPTLASVPVDAVGPDTKRSAGDDPDRDRTVHDARGDRARRAPDRARLGATRRTRPVSARYPAAQPRSARRSARGNCWCSSGRRTRVRLSSAKAARQSTRPAWPCSCQPVAVTGAKPWARSE